MEYFGGGGGSGQDYSFSYTCDNQGYVVHPDSFAFFTTVLTNTGAQADTYRVVLDKDLPMPWYSLASNSIGCFPDSARIPLASAESETITVDIWPFGFTGAGTVTMRVNSLGDSGQTTAMPLTAITNTGVEVLVVDDDVTENYETYYQTALDSTGRSHGTLDNAFTTIGADELAPFSAVVWFTGEATPVLTEEDRQAISSYLDGKGRMFISGQDIAYSLCDSASGESDSSSVAWLKNTLLVEYEADGSGILILDGVDGNPISDGLTLSIFGGDGANNQTGPDVISPLVGTRSPAFPLFLYSGGLSIGGVTIDTEIYRVAYLGFGFEAIDNTEDRALLMERTMDYMFEDWPEPQDSLPPNIINDLVGQLDSGMKSYGGNIYLSWTEPFDSVGVHHYLIYRSESSQELGSLLATTSDTTYLDEYVYAIGKPNLHYYYTVKAVDYAGNKSEGSNQVGEFDKVLRW